MMDLGLNWTAIAQQVMNWSAIVILGWGVAKLSSHLVERWISPSHADEEEDQTDTDGDDRTDADTEISTDTDQA